MQNDRAKMMPRCKCGHLSQAGMGYECYENRSKW